MVLSHAKKEARAEQFEYDLIAEIYSNYEMHPLWVKYHDYIKLPVKDDENVTFEGNGLGSDFDKLKDFIIDFEEQMFAYESDSHFTRVSFLSQNR